jgi:hypothetical protein
MKPSRIAALVTALQLAAAVASATSCRPLSDSNLADQAGIAAGPLLLSSSFSPPQARRPEK